MGAKLHSQAIEKPKRRSHFSSAKLASQLNHDPLYLPAFRMAERIYWANALADKYVEFDEIYDGVLTLMLGSAKQDSR